MNDKKQGKGKKGTIVRNSEIEKTQSRELKDNDPEEIKRRVKQQ